MSEFDKWFDYRNLILALRYDAIYSTVEMTIVKNPDTLEPQATFLAKGVRNLKVDRFHDPGEVCMGDCERYVRKKCPEGYSNEIWTGDAVITFESTGTFGRKR